MQCSAVTPGNRRWPRDPPYSWWDTHGRAPPVWGTALPPHPVGKTWPVVTIGSHGRDLSSRHACGRNGLRLASGCCAVKGPPGRGCGMVDRDALRRLAEALPDGTAVPVPRAWLMELLEPATGAVNARIRPAGASELLPPMDLTPEEAGAALHRSPVTIRAWCAASLLKGAYRLRGRQWRIPVKTLETFQATERARPVQPWKRKPSQRRKSA